MYIPSYYQETDEQSLFSFMQTHNFAVLINSDNNRINATHLPFVVERRGNKIYLVSHMAKANPQGDFLLANAVLIVFQGPHGYISPTNYEKKQNVPTWNYIAVHAYGNARIIDEQPSVIHIMEKMINTFEPGYYNQWKELSDDYKNAMLKGITAFEIEVIRLEGKYKLSQNKTKAERQTIISAFENSNDSLQKELAQEMKNKL